MPILKIRSLKCWPFQVTYSQAFPEIFTSENLWSQSSTSKCNLQVSRSPSSNSHDTWVIGSLIIRFLIVSKTLVVTWSSLRDWDQQDSWPPEGVGLLSGNISGRELTLYSFPPRLVNAVLLWNKLGTVGVPVFPDFTCQPQASGEPN